MITFLLYYGTEEWDGPTDLHGMIDFEDIPKMKALGYKVQFNSCRPNDEDSFIPKTVLNYGEANKGFNWWEENQGGD